MAMILPEYCHPLDGEVPTAIIQTDTTPVLTDMAKRPASFRMIDGDTSGRSSAPPGVSSI